VLKLPKSPKTSGVFEEGEEVPLHPAVERLQNRWHGQPFFLREPFLA
jgi:hypothetical protein